MDLGLFNASIILNLMNIAEDIESKGGVVKMNKTNPISSIGVCIEADSYLEQFCRASIVSLRKG